MDQANEIIGITVPNSLGRQLPTWSQTVTSASTTLENIAGKDTYSRQSNIVRLFYKVEPQLTREQKERL